MIREVQINNLKSIAHLKLELGRINVLIGANGCGKTNILEAICLGGAAVADKLDNEFLAPRGIRYSEPQAMRSGFTKESLKKPIKLGFVRDGGAGVRFSLANSAAPFSGLQLESLTLLTPSGLIAEDLGRIKADSTYPAWQETFKAGFLSDLARFLIYAPDPVALRRLEDEERTQPLGIHGGGLFRLLATLTPEQLQVVKQSLQLVDWFDDFEIPQGGLPGERRLRIRDQYLAEGLTFFEQRAANEGFLFLLFYLCLFISPYTPPFFAIDNLDNGLNPKLCSQLTATLARLAAQHGKQALITTHNPAVLDGLDLKDDEQRLFVVYRNLDGHTLARRITVGDLPQADPPTRLSEAFLRGYIGGLPKNF